MVTNTETRCDGCGGQVDHRSKIVRHEGKITLRECIHCSHIQRCVETIISRENEEYVRFLDKMMGSAKVELDDGMKAKWLRDMLTEHGYVPENQLGEFRRLQRKYDSQI